MFSSRYLGDFLGQTTEQVWKYGNKRATNKQKHEKKKKIVVSVQQSRCVVSYIDLFQKAVVRDSRGSLGDGDRKQIAANCV
jgi:hypothetical protein